MSNVINLGNLLQIYWTILNAGYLLISYGIRKDKRKNYININNFV